MSDTESTNMPRKRKYTEFVEGDSEGFVHEVVESDSDTEVLEGVSESEPRYTSWWFKLACGVMIGVLLVPTLLRVGGATI